MASGLKLYKEFEDLLAEVGEVKIAWFTTFTLSLEFFEKYILSALTQTQPFHLKNLKDYEALNDRLVNAESGPINTKVFYDYRAMRPDIKRTSIQTIGVNPSKLSPAFDHGVFHPKVSLLVNDQKEAWIMTGSANLTLSAWSRNSEGILIKKIEDRHNAQAITDFFLGLLESKSDREQLLSLNSYWQRKLSQKSDWQFIHSLANHQLLDYLKEKPCDEMMVWSPYFAESLSDLIAEEMSFVQQLTIIPDITSSGAIRLTPEELDRLTKQEHVTLSKDLHEYGEELLVHAKVWATPSSLAIGSWNFTKAGLNIASNANNVEAGIVLQIDKKAYLRFKQSLQLKPLAQPKGMELDTIENEKSDLLFNWTMSCQVYADWGTYQYRVTSEDDLSDQTLYIDLPGHKQRVPLQDVVRGGVSFYANHKALLKDRLFTVYDQKEEGNKVFLGVVIELNPKDRPAVGFDSIDDLLRAWCDRKPEEKSQYHQMNYSADTETGEELSEKSSKALKGDYSNAWFTMFLAFEQMRIRLQDASNDPRELSMIGYRIPGSVSQLADHLRFLKNKVDEEEEALSKTFVWFMINEGNQVIKLFNKLNHNKSTPTISPIENLSLDFDGINKASMRKWLQYIQQSCAY